MIPWLELSLLGVLAAVIWLWLDSLSAREIAVRTARAACEAESLLLLDDTVAIAALRPTRDEDGRLQLQRTYDFEYSDTGNNRLTGSIVLTGRHVLLINVGTRPPPEIRTLH